MLLVTQGIPSTLHIRKLIIRGGVNTLNFSWKSDGGNASSSQGNPPQNPFQSNPGFPYQNFPSQNFQNQGFSNQAPHFKNQGPQGFSTNPSQSVHLFPQGNQNHQPYQPPQKRNLEDIVVQFVQSQQSTNTEFRTAINDVKSQITKLTSFMGSSQQEKGKFPSQPIPNPKVKIVLGPQVKMMGPLNIVRLSLLFEVGKQLIIPFIPRIFLKRFKKIYKMNKKG